MPGNNPAQQPAVRQREADALELRKAGFSYERIAATLGYANASGAFKAIGRALARLTAEPAREVRTLEVARLDQLLSGHWPAAVGGDPRAARIVLMIMERRAALLGLDAPVAIDLTAQIRRLGLEYGLDEAEALAEAERVLGILGV